MGLGFIKDTLNSKHSGDIILNMISMVFVGISGLLYTSIIALYYTPAVLGLFNTTYAYYIVFSQVSAFGIHFSVLKYTSEYAQNQEMIKKIFSTSIVGTLLASISFSIILFVAFRIIALYYPGEILTALNLILPALIFFSLNKVLLNYLNGLMEMKKFAFYYSFRYVLLILSIIILTVLRADGLYLSVSFFLSEFLMFVVMIIHLATKKLVHWSFDRSWLQKHFKFGSCIFLGNLVLDLNTRVDVIILGFFTDQAVVGIYSFALVFAEGFYQILMVLRRNINPRITRYYKDDPLNLEKLKNNISKKLKIFVPILCGLVFLAFYVLCILLNRDSYLLGIVPLLFLAISISINSFSIVFGNTMSQTGFPTQETMINLYTILANIAGNFLLIPFWGMVGAAISTSVSYFVFARVLSHYCKKYIFLDANQRGI